MKIMQCKMFLETEDGSLFVGINGPEVSVTTEPLTWDLYLAKSRSYGRSLDVFIRYGLMKLPGCLLYLVYQFLKFSISHPILMPVAFVKLIVAMLATLSFILIGLIILPSGRLGVRISRSSLFIAINKALKFVNVGENMMIQISPDQVSDELLERVRFVLAEGKAPE